jgi:hypothetical protein
MFVSLWIVHIQVIKIWCVKSMTEVNWISILHFVHRLEYITSILNWFANIFFISYIHLINLVHDYANNEVKTIGFTQQNLSYMMQITPVMDFTHQILMTYKKEVMYSKRWTKCNIEIQFLKQGQLTWYGENLK